MIEKCIILLVLIVYLNATICLGYQYEEKTITVKVDHFTYKTNETFQLRYLINDTYKRQTYSPILFYTGNEGKIENFADATGYMWDIAPSLGATIVFAEHRYYGKSLPFGDESLADTEHLGYLTSEQALADYAELVKFLNPPILLDGHKVTRPVIAFGGSYGGMLATWFRMKYPYLVSGALASSAPIFQFSNLVPCSSFSDITSRIFSSATCSGQCFRNIKASWNIIRKLAETEDGSTLLNDTFKFCPNFDIEESVDQKKFQNYLNAVYGNLAMVNYPYPTSFLTPLPAYPVQEFCSRFNDYYDYDNTQFIQAFQAALTIYSNYSGNVNCLDINSSYNSDVGVTQFDFQSCTEMVMPMCTNEKLGAISMYPKSVWNFQEYSDSCFERHQIRPNENEIITRYGGKQIQEVTNIIFSNGLLDPWSGGGVFQPTNPKTYVIIIDDAAHHFDLRASNPADPPSVVAARQKEFQLIVSFIEEHYYNARSYDVNAIE